MPAVLLTGHTAMQNTLIVPSGGQDHHQYSSNLSMEG